MSLTSSRRRLLLTAATGLAAAAAGGWYWQRQQARNAVTAALWESSFPDPEGRSWAMAPLRGKPVVVNFWATWCAPCVKELPQFDRFHREYSQRGWQVVGLAIDSPMAVAEFLKRTPVSFPIGVAGMDGAELMLALGNSHGVLPFTTVLDAAGDVVRKRVGETSYDELVRWTNRNA
ncbi:TlpA family protein disulfide reductase [Ideonella sp. BN130291]|uniref:TlpA family protein disulfide reductase n=1 Tax=Ideonella sp. BN130291 TaxID=3112940 RepID=UPI002E262378|nr:TlpA disulfide reductase family protein [Ideonella sp. BN130291]